MLIICIAVSELSQRLREVCNERETIQHELHDQVERNHSTVIDSFEDLLPQLSPGKEGPTNVNNQPIDYLNYHLLEHIGRELGNEELKSKAVEYRYLVQQFEKNTTIAEFVESPKNKGRVQKILSAKEDYVEQKVNVADREMYAMLEDVERVRRHLSQKRSVPLHAIQFLTAAPGSLVLTFRLKSPLQYEIQKQKNVKKLSCRGDTLEVKMDEQDSYLHINALEIVKVNIDELEFDPKTVDVDITALEEVSMIGDVDQFVSVDSLIVAIGKLYYIHYVHGCTCT